MKMAVKEWAQRVALLAGSMIFALLLAEVVTRWVHPIWDGRDNVTVAGEKITAWFDPGSVYRQVSNEYDALTTITDKGHRVPGSEGSPEVIFLGDSFTYGWGIPDADTFASIYCRERRVACANLGVPGTGTAKQLHRLEAFLDTYAWQPRQVKLFFFGMSSSWSAGNDFVDNFNERGVGETVRPSGPPPGGPPPSGGRPAPRSRSLRERVIGMQSAILGNSNLMRLSKYYWGPLLKSLVVADPGENRMAEALRYTKMCLERLDQLSRDRGFSYEIYLLVPVQDVIRGSYDQTLATLNSVAPIAAIPTAQLFLETPQAFYYSYDGHINPRGAKRLGEFLASRDREQSAAAGLGR